MVFATAAVGGHAEFALQSPQVANAGLCRAAYLLIGDRVTEADVHDFKDLQLMTPH